METTQNMSTSEALLATHPSIGIMACIIAILTPFIGAVLPIVQLSVAIVGLAIGILTLEAKWKERKIKNTKKPTK